MTRADRAFEPIARLARAAASVPVDEPAVRDARSRFLHRLNGQGARGFSLGLALAAVGGIAGVLMALRTPEPSRPPLTAGADLPVLQGGTLVRFRDGSELELEPDGRGRLAEVAPAGARVLLEDGALRVKVTPRPDARWTIEAGPFRVKVKGTTFRVRWDELGGRFDLEMVEGAVVVTGPRTERRLRAGQRMSAARDGRLVELTPGPPAEPPPPPPGRPPAPIRPTAPRAIEPPGWSQLLRDGALDTLIASAEAEGLARALNTRGVDDLAALATAARLSDRFALARRVFRAQRVRFPASEAAGEAAFHLGRLADDVDRDPAAAVAWYDRYLDESPSGTFAAEALARKLTALAGQSDPASQEAARATARAYLARFPEGPARDQARRLLAP